MQIVIDINDKLYDRIKYLEPTADTMLDKLMRSVQNGTPLPKHGRLIDADAIEYTHAIARCLEDGHNWNELCVTENELYDAPTIIEADKAEESEG